jgi:hypothetical protein
MIRDVFEVLESTFLDERLRACDLKVVREDGVFGIEGWLDGPGAMATIQALDKLADIAYEQGKQNGRVLSALRKSAEFLLAEVTKYVATTPTFAETGAMDVLGEARTKLADLGRLEATRLLDDAVGRAEASAAAASTAAGIAGDATMASFYSELATEERISANTFRRITVTMAFTAAGSAALFIMGPALGVGWLDIAADDYVHLFQRAVFIAGVFGLAGYFARQAHQHRSMANWSSSLAVQLKTFDAYLSAIESPEAKDELRKSFGARVFGDHPAMKGEPTVTPSAAAMDTAVGWAAKLTAGGK